MAGLAPFDAVREISDKVIDALSPRSRSKTRKRSGGLEVDEAEVLSVDGMDVVGPNGILAIHKAATLGNHTAIKEYISQGATVDATSGHSMTALHYACSSGNLGAMRVLLYHNADLEALDCCRRTPLLHSVLGNWPDAARLLLDAGADHSACAADSVLESSALHICATKGFPGVARILLDAGADINKKNAHGYTPYAIAQDWGSQEMCDFFAQAGGLR